MAGCLLSFLRLLLCFAFIGFGSSAFAVDITGVWTGTYTCSGKETIATLTIKDEHNARLDFAPSKDTPVYSAGAYALEVWYRADEVLLTASEWINKTGSFVMVDFRLKATNDSLHGLVLYRNCGEIRLQKITSQVEAEVNPSTANTALNTESAADPDFPMHLTGLYSCKGKGIGHYWIIKKNVDNSLSLDVASRSKGSALTSKIYTAKLLESDGFYSGQANRGGFGFKVKFPTTSKFPQVTWLDSRGREAEGNCSEIVFKRAQVPELQWDHFFAEANRENANIDEIVNAVYLYTTLPAVSSLAALDRENYKIQRKAAWSTLQRNFVHSVPDQLKVLPVSSVEERVAARRQVAKMMDPGFGHNIAVGELYARHLLDSNAPLEPIFFTEPDVACARLKSSGNFIRSVRGVSWFVGLPAIFWNKELARHVLDTVEQCASEDASLGRVAKRVTGNVTALAPAIDKESQKIRWLTQMADDMLAQPAELKTLVATNKYELSAATLRRENINKEDYQRFFVARVESVREDAVKNASLEIKAFFEQDIADFQRLSRIHSSCVSEVGAIGHKSPRWLVQLADSCNAHAGRKLTSIVATLNAEEGKKVINQGNAVTVLTQTGNLALIEFAKKIGANHAVRSYLTHQNNIKNSAADILTEKMATDFLADKEALDSNIVSLCSDRRLEQYMENVCRVAVQKIGQRKQQKQCAYVVSQMQVPASQLGKTILYGEALDSKKIKLTELICRLHEQGMVISVSEEGVVKGVEQKVNREIFSAELLLVGESANDEYWEFGNLELKLEDTGLEAMSSRQLVACMINRFLC